MNRRQRKERQKRTAQKYSLSTFELNENYKSYKSQKRARNNLEKQYKDFVKKSNRRLLALEKLSTKKGYENILTFAYRKAMIDIQSFVGDNKKRFSTATKNLSNRQLEGRINAMLEFLNSPSSTKKGIEKVWSNREAVITSRYGISWEKALDVFERGIIKKYENDLNSDLILKVIATHEADKKKFDAFMKEATNKDYRSLRNPESIIKYISQAKASSKLKEEDLLNYANTQTKDN